MLELDEDRMAALLETFVSSGTSPFWTADFMRDLIWEHGLAQNRVSNPSEALLSREITEQLRDRFAARMNQEEMRGQLLSRQSLLGYLYAWKEMSSLETVKDWIKEVSSTDHGLIDLLMSLRTNVFSSDKGAYRRIDHEQVKDFFDDWGGVRERVKQVLEDKMLDPELLILKSDMEVSLIDPIQTDIPALKSD
ncbi:hypothetical protein [Enterobacter cloacae complex sp.]|nr:hypothetical protein [Enterobacter cloacae complex sp.]